MKEDYNDGIIRHIKETKNVNLDEFIGIYGYERKDGSTGKDFFVYSRRGNMFVCRDRRRPLTVAYVDELYDYIFDNDLKKLDEAIDNGYIFQT